MPSAPPRRALAIVQAAAAAAPVLLCLSFLLRLPGAAGQALFLFLALASGLLGGCQFRLASHIYFASHGVGGPGESACPANPAGLGTLYALDLAGSAAGAALFAVWLIPVFGFFRAALLTAELNLAAALLALPARKPRRPI